MSLQFFESSQFVLLTGLELLNLSAQLFRNYSLCNLFFNLRIHPLVQCLYSENKRVFFVKAKNLWRCILLAHIVYHVFLIQRNHFSILKQTRKKRRWRKRNGEREDKLVDKIRRIKRDISRKKYVYWTSKLMRCIARFR